MAVRIDWKSPENLSYLFFSLTIAGLIQFGVILFAFYFLPMIDPYLLILVPLGVTILNAGSAILFAEFFIQNRHKKIVQDAYKKPKREITIGTALIFSNLLIIGIFLVFFSIVTYFYLILAPADQGWQLIEGFFIPLTTINVLNLPAFLTFMAADLGGAVPPFGLAFLLDLWVRRPIKIKKRRLYAL